jgi:hypothetical protein
MGKKILGGAFQGGYASPPPVKVRKPSMTGGKK